MPVSAQPQVFDEVRDTSVDKDGQTIETDEHILLRKDSMVKETLQQGLNSLTSLREE